MYNKCTLDRSCEVPNGSGVDSAQGIDGRVRLIRFFCECHMPQLCYNTVMFPPVFQAVFDGWVGGWVGGCMSGLLGLGGEMTLLPSLFHSMSCRNTDVRSAAQIHANPSNIFCPMVSMSLKRSMNLPNSQTRWTQVSLKNNTANYFHRNL